MTTASPEVEELQDLNFVHTLSPIHATTVEGERIRFGTLWEDQTAVLLFLRHFG